MSKLYKKQKIKSREKQKKFYTKTNIMENKTVDNSTA